MSKKLVIIIFCMICMFVGFNFVNAENVSNFIDIQSYDKIYKMSEDSEVTLPFIKVFDKSATFDKALNKSGLSIGSETLEIGEKVSGIQTIVSRDTVDIKGTMEYGVIMAANVVISGNVEKDIFIIAESIFITDTAKISGDVVAMAQTIEVKGNIDGNFIANAQDLLMQGKVMKDFRVSSETLKFDNMEVEGNIYIETNSDINISDQYPNATVKKMSTNGITKEEKRANIASTIKDCVIGTVLFALLNFLVIKIRPNVFKDLANKFKNHSTYAILIAVAGLLTIPLITTILIILSIIGLAVVTIPALVIYIVFIIVIVALAKFITGSVLYELFKDKLKVGSKLKQFCMLLGIYALLYILCNLPAIGWLMTMATILFSAGFVITGLTRKKEMN